MKRTVARPDVCGSALGSCVGPTVEVRPLGEVRPGFRLLVVCFVLLCLGTAHSLAVDLFRLVVADPRATGPVINDSDEVVYSRDGQIISSTRGLLVACCTRSLVGLSNTGEVVYGNDADELISTVRGVLVASGSAPNISPSSGDVCYVNIGAPGNVFSTVAGQITFIDPSLETAGGHCDVNDGGTCQ